MKTETKWEYDTVSKYILPVSTNEKKIKKKDYLPHGTYPVIDQGQEFIGGYCNDKTKLVDENLPVIIFGDHTKVLKYVDFPFVPGADGVKVLKPNPEFNPKLFYYFLHCAEFPDKGYSRHYQYLLKSRLNKPPYLEQDKILNKIEELLSNYEAGKINLVKIKDKLDIYKQSVLHSAFEGKYTDLSDAKKVTVKDICLDIVGGGTPSTTNKKYWDGDIDWITSADIQDIRSINPRKKLTQEGIKNSTTNPVPRGTIIVVTRVGLGKLAIADRELCFSQDLQGLILNKDLIDEDYALHFLSNAVQIFKYQNRGTTISGVTKKQLADLKLLLPTKDKQKIIIQEIDKRLSIINSLGEQIEQQLNDIEKLKLSILHTAFQGRLSLQK